MREYKATNWSLIEILVSGSTLLVSSLLRRCATNHPYGDIRSKRNGNLRRGTTMAPGLKYTGVVGHFRTVKRPIPEGCGTSGAAKLAWKLPMSDNSVCRAVCVSGLF